MLLPGDPRMTELDIHLQQSVPLDLRGVVRGSAVRLFEGWRDAGVPADAAPSVPAGVDPDEVVPDPFAFIAECVDLGFFVPSASARGEPSFVVRSTTRARGPRATSSPTRTRNGAPMSSARSLAAPCSPDSRP